MRLENLPSVAMYKDWQSWAEALMRQLQGTEFGVTAEVDPSYVAGAPAGYSRLLVKVTDGTTALEEDTETATPVDLTTTVPEIVDVKSTAELADATATVALADAGAAQDDATDALTDAASAQGTANTAVTNAATAQSTADQAEADALAAAREAARLTSYPNPTNVLSAKDAGSDASIDVAAHVRVYPVQGDIDVPDVSIAVAADAITGLAFSTQYSVYYDDTTLVDTTPTFQAVVTSTNHADAQPGAAAGRHFVGVVTTPADAGAPTTGTGGTPPGGGGGTVLP